MIKWHCDICSKEMPHREMWRFDYKCSSVNFSQKPTKIELHLCLAHSGILNDAVKTALQELGYETEQATEDA